MAFNIGDIVRLSSGVSYYKIHEVRNGFPYKIEYVQDKFGTQTLTPNNNTFKDLKGEWHTYDWILVTRAKDSIVLSEHDKKYEKIILKIKQLEKRFKERIVYD